MHLWDTPLPACYVGDVILVKQPVLLATKPSLQPKALQLTWTVDKQFSCKNIVRKDITILPCTHPPCPLVPTLMTLPSDSGADTVGNT